MIKKIPTQNLSKSASASLSHFKIPNELEKGRLLRLFVDPFLDRASFNLDCLSTPKGFTSLVWISKDTSASKKPFMLFNKDLLRIFSALFYSRSFHSFKLFTQFSPVSFVPNKIRYRKNNIYGGFNISFINPKRALLAWRYSFSFADMQGYLKPSFCYKNTKAVSKSYIVSGAEGVFIVGCDYSNFSSMKLSFNCFPFTYNTRTNYISLSFPKSLKSSSLDKISFLNSVFRF